VLDGAGRLAGAARYVPGAGISIDAASQTVSLAACAEGQVLVHDAAAWRCAEPSPGTVTSVGAAAPLSAIRDTVDDAQWSGAALSVAHGGTGAASLSGVVHGSGTGALTAGTVDLASEIAGMLAVEHGGSGAASLTGVLHGNGTGAFSAGNVDVASETSGMLAVGRGGTGAASLTGVVHGSGAGALTAGNVALATEVTGTLAVANGGTGSSSAAPAGSVFFAGTDGIHTQNASQLFWDGTNNRLGVGTAGPAARLEIGAGSDTSQILWVALIRNAGNANASGYGAGLKLKMSDDSPSLEVTSGRASRRWPAARGRTGPTSRST